MAAAAMGRAGDGRLATLTLFAAQTDFSEPGELALFIDPSQMHFLESMMWDRGYLSASQMAGAFQILKSNDLVWSRLVHDYLMGERTPMNDLMAGMPIPRACLTACMPNTSSVSTDNELASGRFIIDGRPAALQNIRVPMFVVGTERDHVAPWRSVYKIHQLADTDVTFVLASGGHNAGIVSEPGHRGRRYRIATGWQPTSASDPTNGQQRQRRGRFRWEAWLPWLATHSGKVRVAPPQLGAAERGFPAIAEAPGAYVFQK